MIDWQSLRDTTGVLALLEYADKVGLARAQCVEGTNIDIAALEVPFATVRAWQELALIRNVQAASKRAGRSGPLGLEIAPYYNLAAFGILGLGMAASRDVETAFKFAGAYQTFGLSFSRLRTLKENGVLTVSVDERAVPSDCQTFCVERGLAVTAQLVWELAGARVAPQILEMRMEEGTADADAYQAFFGIAPRFGAKRNRAVFPPGVAETALLSANRKTLRMAEHYCAEMRAVQTRDVDLDRRLRAELVRRRFQVNAIDLAATIGISERSLRRILAARGANLRALVLETKMAHARSLLEGGQTVAETATATGYAEAASFSRAFKIEVGMTPSAYRHRSIA